MPEGAPILGSKVSVWGGPPCMKRKTTDFPVRRLSESAARAAARSASERPPRARLPTRRKSRRFQPGSRKLSMPRVPPAYSTPWKEETGRPSSVYSLQNLSQETDHADPTRPAENDRLGRRGLGPARLDPPRRKDPARRGVLFAEEFQTPPGH